MLEAIMLKKVVFLLTVLFVLQYDNVRGNPLLNPEHSVNIDVHRNTRQFPPTPNNWPYFYHSWSLPTFPSFSMGSLFKDKDDDITVLNKKITALEESQKEILELLKQYTTDLNNFSTTVASNDANFQTASKTRCDDKVIAANDEMKPGASDITDDKKGGSAEGTKTNHAQSISATINGDSTDAVATNVGKESAAPTKVDEKKETPAKNDDAQTHATLNGNEEKGTIGGDGEKAEFAEKPEKAENSDATQELPKPQYNHSEKNERPGSLENDAAESNALAIHQDGGKTDIEMESDSEVQAAENEGAAESAPIIAFVKPSSSDTNVKED